MKSSGTILIADDEPEMCVLLEDVLGKDGHTCGFAHEAAEVEKLVSTRSWDLLICDVNMPGNSNLELIKQLKSQSKQVPVILITGHPTVDIATQAFKLRLVGLLPKPFDNEEIRNLVADTIKSNRLTQVIGNNPAFKEMVQTSLHRQRAVEIFQDLTTLNQKVELDLEKTETALVQAPTELPPKVLASALRTNLQHLRSNLETLEELANLGARAGGPPGPEIYSQASEILQKMKILLSGLNPALKDNELIPKQI